jgi:formate hydrogenlyase subunit 6/NADH:ubiquinone oxidoreductase subunit I
VRFIDSGGLARLAQAIARDYDLYGPQEVDGRLAVTRISAEGRTPEITWNAYRLAESLKPLWLQTGKILSQWTPDGPIEGPRPRPRAVFGAKACDVRALGILDRVLRDHEFKEPAWCAAREQNLLITGDCTGFGESCFCTMLGDRPWPAELFDLNLSPVDGGFLVEAGSEAGERLLREHAPAARGARTDEMEVREKRRQEVEAGVREQNAAWPTKDPFEKSVEKNLRTRIWGSLAATCVECNACNLVCPTCHCFLLHERKTDDGAVRLSLWDSCFHAGYARMAGGGTPRLQLTERFKNHYYHKFVSFPRNWGVTACSGCGRCIDACMGRIDKRQCLHRLETEWIPSEVLEEVD